MMIRGLAVLLWMQCWCQSFQIITFASCDHKWQNQEVPHHHGDLASGRCTVRPCALLADFRATEHPLRPPGATTLGCAWMGLAAYSPECVPGLPLQTQIPKLLAPSWQSPRQLRLSFGWQTGSGFPAGLCLALWPQLASVWMLAA